MLEWYTTNPTLCRWIGHAWENAAFGSRYDPNSPGTREGPPPIVSSWRGLCKRCGKHKEETEYESPQSIVGFVQSNLRR